MSRTALKSGLYECTVLHERFEPRRHRFAYRIFYFALDLDEADCLGRRLALFSTRRPRPFRFRERDFLPNGEELHNPSDPRPQAPIATGGRLPLKARALAFCASKGAVCGPDGRVVLVTLPRVLGFQFNPVSFYFCFDSAGRPAGAIAEVTNTFREVKLYFVPPDLSRVGRPVFRVRVPKEFYVSPFSELNLEFDLALHTPGQKLAMRIDDYRGGHRILHSTLTGRRVPLSDFRLAWFLLKYPAVTLKVVALIHWQALRLWLKSVPHFRKSAGAGYQRDLYRPHASISNLSPR